MLPELSLDEMYDEMLASIVRYTDRAREAHRQMTEGRQIVDEEDTQLGYTDDREMPLQEYILDHKQEPPRRIINRLEALSIEVQSI